MKAEAVFRDRLGAAEADERRPGSGDKPAHEVLSRRRRIAGRNREARDRKKAAQLAPIVPAPITATWRISLLVTPAPPSDQRRIYGAALHRRGSGLLLHCSAQRRCHSRHGFRDQPCLLRRAIFASTFFAASP